MTRPFYTDLANSPSADGFVGNDQSTNFRTAAVQTLVATTGTAQIPGPAAGYLRVVAAAYLTALGSTPTLTCTLNPGGYVFARALATITAASASLGTPSVGPAFIIGNGETLDYTNTGSADAILTYYYYDIPATNRTLVRGTFTQAGITIIPTPAAGTYSKIVTAASGGLTGTINTAAFVWNDDTISRQLQIKLGGALIIQDAARATQTRLFAYQFVHGIAITPTTGAMTLATVEANTTRPCVLAACYETFSGTP